MAKVNRTGLEGRESYLGFTFGGVHSSELQIVRVYDQRLTEQVLPQQTDKFIQLPNSDRTTYYGRNFGPLEITVSFAYDDLSEKGKRRLKQVFANDKLQELIFDEEPYKTYMAKVSGQPILNFVPFDDPEYGRVYRGEGEVSFFIPYPLAYAKYKNIADYDGNRSEWDKAYNFQNETNKWTLQGDNYLATVHNNGDVDAPFKLYFSTEYEKDGKVAIRLNTLGSDGKRVVKAMFLDFTYKQEPKSPFFCYDSELKLLYGVKEDLSTKTGEIANDIIVAGNFFDLPLGKSDIRIDNAVPSKVTPVHKTNGNEEEAIEFKYWYY